ncbi:hypothetical protein DSECCO2_21690 [anaerobic digester metagenome]
MNGFHKLFGFFTWGAEWEIYSFRRYIKNIYVYLKRGEAHRKKWCEIMEIRERIGCISVLIECPVPSLTKN